MILQISIWLNCQKIVGLVLEEQPNYSWLFVVVGKWTCSQEEKFTGEEIKESK